MATRLPYPRVRTPDLDRVRVTLLPTRRGGWGCRDRYASPPPAAVVLSVPRVCVWNLLQSQTKAAREAAHSHPWCVPGRDASTAVWTEGVTAPLGLAAVDTPLLLVDGRGRCCQSSWMMLHITYLTLMRVVGCGTALPLVGDTNTGRVHVAIFPVPRTVLARCLPLPPCCRGALTACVCPSPGIVRAADAW